VSRPYKSDPFVGAARITSRPYRSICRGGWCLGSRARHYRGGSITSRPYKKFVPLLKIIFYVVVVGVRLTREVMEVLKGGQIPASWNETTIARVLKEKYFANSSVLDAMPKSNMSYT